MAIKIKPEPISKNNPKEKILKSSTKVKLVCWYEKNNNIVLIINEAIIK